jgi:ubiquinone/menaquinone biosynthesis C-methylase UbiE
MNIDQSEDPERFVRLMDSARGEKDDPCHYRNLFRLLEAVEGERILDVGCGQGGAARMLSQQFGAGLRVIGIDSSTTMIKEAQRRTVLADLPVAFHVADVHNLPFAECFFDACYSLGLFEVVGDPVQALREMARVTRSGGRIVIHAPDIDLLAIDSPYKRLTREILHYICDNETNGWIGRQLPGLFKEEGLTDVYVEPASVIVTDFNQIYDLWLENWLDGVLHAGVASRAEIAEWLEDLKRRHQAGTFLCSQTLFRVVGRKP